MVTQQMSDKPGDKNPLFKLAGMNKILVEVFLKRHSENHAY